MSRPINLSSAEKFSKASAPPLRRGRKRGPKDGWGGLRTKILRVISLRYALTSREIAQFFNITRRAVLYHLKSLIEAGFVRRGCPNPKCPYQVYICAYWVGDIENSIFNVADVEGGFRACDGLVFDWLVHLVFVLGRPVGVKDLSDRVDMSVRSVQRSLRRLIEMGLVVGLGGCHCRWRVYMPAPRPLSEREIQLFNHKHRHTSLHRYRYSTIKIL